MAAVKDIWKIIPFFVVAPLFFFLLGDTKWALISLALIPLVFICWGLSVFFSDKSVSEIGKHMTEEERRHFAETGNKYGRKLAFLAVFMGATYFTLFYLVRLELSAYYIIPFALFALIAFLLGLRFRKEMRRFASAARRARERGRKKEP